MPTIQIELTLSAECYREYEAEAERRGVSIQSLIQECVNALVAEQAAARRDLEDDHPVIVC